jgi:hypothetical protein
MIAHRPFKKCHSFLDTSFFSCYIEPALFANVSYHRKKHLLFRGKRHHRIHKQKEVTVGGSKLLAVVLRLSAAISLAGMMGSCSNSESPIVSNGSSRVSLGVTFSKVGTASSLSKTLGVAAADSLRIDSAVVVFQKIKFYTHVDTVSADTSDHEAMENDGESMLMFRGPFVVHVRDTVAIRFASQTLPAAAYDGISFKIHRLGTRERHEDSDDFNHHLRTVSDSSLEGSSITVWGAIKKDGAWTPFVFKYNGEAQFKIKGDFVVAEATSEVKIALNFDMAKWFTNPDTGALLDPTDQSGLNRSLFNRAIKLAFGMGRGGHDFDGDGHPDH